MEVHFIIYAGGLVQFLFLAELLEVGLGHERISKARFNEGHCSSIAF